MQRIRITYKKSGDIIYTSNLDLQKIWERTCRRAKLSIAYSLGFHPQARIQQAAPLPLGFLSRTEIVDIWLDMDTVFSDLQERINFALPNGLDVIRIEIIDLKDPALQNRITSSVYQVELPQGTSKDLLEQNIRNLLLTNELKIIKRGKTINLRERIESIELLEKNSSEQLSMVMRLTQRPGLTGRPDDILNAMGVDPFLTKIERINLIFS
jgi:radical SAM-linked protein